MPDEPEYLTAGPEPGPRRGVLLLLVGVIAVLVVLLVVQLRGPADPGASSTPTPTPTPPATSPATTEVPVQPVSTPTGKAPVTTRGQGPLADDVPAGTLYARSGSRLYAIDVRTGAVTTTDGATTADRSSDVLLIPTREGLILTVPMEGDTRLVADGHPAGAAPGSLGQAEELLPGPLGQVWSVLNADPGSARLYGDDGAPAGPQLTPGAGQLTPDGAGGLLLNDVGGFWQVDGTSVRQLTTGGVIAVGPRTYELYECDADHRCGTVLLDRSSGVRTVVDSNRPDFGATGRTSPEGGMAANVRYGPNDDATVSVVRFSDGRTLHEFSGRVNAYGVELRSAVWLSERWLAVIDGGRLELFDTSGGTVVRTGLDLDRLSQLAWRAD